MTTVRFTDVVRRYGRLKAVDGISFALEPGRIYGLLGPNGAGKSTTTRLMLGFAEADAGEVLLLGGRPSAKRRGRVGFVPEERTLPEKAVVHDLLVFYGQIRGLSRRDAISRAARWLSHFQLEDKARAKVETLSNGQQQKVQIILALLSPVELLVLDEPLTALDPTHQAQALEAFRKATVDGTTVLMATHRLWEAQAFVEHVLLVNKGKLIVDAPLADALAAGAENRWRIRTSNPAWLGDRLERLEGDVAHVLLEPEESVGPLLARAGGDLLAVERVLPSLHDVFLASLT